jgi:hypothetical protein
LFDYDNDNDNGAPSVGLCVQISFDRTLGRASPKPPELGSVSTTILEKWQCASRGLLPPISLFPKFIFLT